MRAGLAGFFCLYILASVSGAETPNRTAAPETPAGVEETNLQQPFTDIKIKDNLLSVTLKDAEFGKVMDEIAKRAGFKVYIEAGSYGRKLSTSFKNMDMESGISRLISRIGVKNYFIHYDSKGNIREVEVYSGTVKPATSTTKGTPAPSQQRRLPQPFSPRPAASQQRPIPQPVTPLLQQAPDTGDEERMEEILDEPAPYIPPRQEPVYIPPAPKAR